MWGKIKDFLDYHIFAVIIITISVVIIGGASFLIYKSCDRQAEIYNKINRTNYTTSDFFWASEQINQQTQTIKLSR